jgi:anti-anti-sigma factor
MPSRTPEHWLEVETIGNVAVGRFIHCRILHEAAVEEAGRQMLALVNDSGCKNVLLNLDNVEGMTTAFLGKLVALYNQVTAGGGRLALCRVRPILMEIFNICHFPGRSSIYPGEQEALDSF